MFFTPLLPSYVLGEASDSKTTLTKKASGATRRYVVTSSIVAENRYEVGMPLRRALGDGLWEVRTSLPRNRIACVLFRMQQGRILVLHGFIKKTQKTRRTTWPLRAAETVNLKMKETNMARKKRGIRSTAKLTTLDDFLGEEGKRDE